VLLEISSGESQQRRVRLGGLAELFFPGEIPAKVIPRSLAYADNPPLAAFAASDCDGGECSVQMHVPAIQPGDTLQPPAKASAARCFAR